jgi:hypothetical protein
MMAAITEWCVGPALGLAAVAFGEGWVAGPKFIAK